jgi:hypothetical protein
LKGQSVVESGNDNIHKTRQYCTILALTLSTTSSGDASTKFASTTAAVAIERVVHTTAPPRTTARGKVRKAGWPNKEVGIKKKEKMCVFVIVSSCNYSIQYTAGRATAVYGTRTTTAHSHTSSSNRAPPHDACWNESGHTNNDNQPTPHTTIQKASDRGTISLWPWPFFSPTQPACHQQSLPPTLRSWRRRLNIKRWCRNNSILHRPLRRVISGPCLFPPTLDSILLRLRRLQASPRPLCP